MCYDDDYCVCYDGDVMMVITATLFEVMVVGLW